MSYWSCQRCFPYLPRSMVSQVDPLLMHLVSNWQILISISKYTIWHTARCNPPPMPEFLPSYHEARSVHAYACSTDSSTSDRSMLAKPVAPPKYPLPSGIESRLPQRQAGAQSDNPNSSSFLRPNTLILSKYPQTDASIGPTIDEPSPLPGSRPPTQQN